MKKGSPKLLARLKKLLRSLFSEQVDWSGRREDSCGKSWPGETPQAWVSPRRLPDCPRKAKRL
ncbi:hypothetical protein [Neobacillus piezotolerans]|uniref:hypothetical protein n=1 Tax=Neobacillus piezotolerans TaxID=2259171 RepID=UPI0015F1320E|nr:hypothetical protein [Neobacillus piezotolerans]